MYLVPVTNGHPKLKAWKYPLVGDKDVTMIERVVIDVDARKVVRLKMPPDQHRSTCATTSAAAAAATGTTCSGAPMAHTSPSSPPRAITSRNGFASPMPPPATSAR